MKVYVCVTLDLAFSLKCGCFSAHNNVIIFKIHIYKAICQGTVNKYGETISALFKSPLCGINSTLVPYFVKSQARVTEKAKSASLCKL